MCEQHAAVPWNKLVDRRVLGTEKPCSLRARQLCEVQSEHVLVWGFWDERRMSNVLEHANRRSGALVRSSALNRARVLHPE